jgi:uncharacterized protein YeaO (DUF488 family)
MIYTGYFAMAKHYPNPISIALYPPKWFKGLSNMTSLAPSKELLGWWKSKKEHTKEDESEYTERYLKENRSGLLLAVKKLGVIVNSEQLIGEKLPNLPTSPDLDYTLLCYEKPGDFCHRHIVAQFLREHGIPCEEFKV